MCDEAGFSTGPKLEVMRHLDGRMNIDRSFPDRVVKGGEAFRASSPWLLDHAESWVHFCRSTREVGSSGVGELIAADQSPIATDQLVQTYRFKRGIHNRAKSTNVPVIQSSYVQKYFSELTNRQRAHSVIDLVPFVNMKYTK